jgi:hypothetical protein
LRGETHLASVAAVLDVLDEVSDKLVFLGGCVPAFYARPTGAPIRPTKDVDCMSTMSPWVLQEQILARLCAFGQLSPVPDTQFRYQVPGTDLLIDVMSPDGVNIGGGTRWMREAAEHAARHVLPNGRIVRVVTPPYFVVLKLSAFLDRGPDLMSGKDMEDLVFIAVEIEDLSDQVRNAGLSEPVASLWQRAFSKHSVDDGAIPEIVEYHLHPGDAQRSGTAIATLVALATGAVAAAVKPEAKRMLSERQLRVGQLTTAIQIKLWVSDPPSGGVWFTQSHYIKTPAQLGAYHTSRPWGDDAEAAFSRAMLSVMSFYDEAVRAGHIPSDAWLVPNPKF